MDEKILIEITKATVDEMDRVLRLGNSEYIKEFGCEADRTDKAKIEKTVNMVSTLNFFIDQYYSQVGGRKCKCQDSGASEKTPLYEDTI